MAHILTDTGLILITSITDVDENEINMLKALNRPHKTIVVNIGENTFSDGQVDLNIEKNDSIEQSAELVKDLILKTIVPDPEYCI